MKNGRREWWARLVPVGELAEDVLDHDDRLLHDVVDLGLDELEQHVDAPLRGALELDGAAADGAHRAAHELDVDLGRVLLELHEHLVDVAVARELDHDLELLHLDVDRVVVLAEEDLDLVREDGGPLLHDEVDVAQRHVLDLGLRREQRHQRRRHLLVQRLERVLARDQVHVLDHHLVSGEG